MQREKTKDMILCAMFVVLIAAGAFLKVPVPVVPFTLQFLFTMLAGLLLGPRLGALAVAVYVLLGLAGLPVFAQGGGLAYVFQPTFGYLIGFVLGTWVTGAIARRETGLPGFGRLLGANLAGLAVVYLCGMLYCWVVTNYYLNTPMGLWALVLYCFLLAVPGDLFLCVVGAMAGRRLLPLVGIRRERGNGRGAKTGGQGPGGAEADPTGGGEAVSAALGTSVPKGK